MEPVRLSHPVPEAVTRLERTILSMPRASVVSREEDYLHAEFRSVLLGFVDDVEFWIDEQEGLIHFRSASRVGHSDMGLNRQRMQEMKRRFGAP